MTGSPALSDDLCHLVDLALGTAESSESLLCELAGALVLAVSEEFDNAALVWCEAVGGEEACQCLFIRGIGRSSDGRGLACMESDIPRDLLDNIPDESSALAEVTLHARHARLHCAGGDFLQWWNSR